MEEVSNQEATAEFNALGKIESIQVPKAPELTQAEKDLINKARSKVSQEQIQDLLFGETLSWHSIIFDLINTEQLKPWDIDISLLANKYLERIKKLEEANFFISSKVLLAAAILLRMKSEILLDYDIPGIDAMLFGKKEEKKYYQEHIELDEDIPSLLVKTPLPRFKKVTLEELMKALGKAINTENRRIKRVVIAKQQEYEAAMFLPKQKIDLKDKIREVYASLKKIFENREEKLAFSEFSGPSIEDRITSFVPLLHLDNQQKIWLEQEGHLQEIWILLKHLYDKQNAQMLAQMKKEVEEEMKNFDENLDKNQLTKAEEIENDFENPLEEELEEAMEKDSGDSIRSREDEE